MLYLEGVPQRADLLVREDVELNGFPGDGFDCDRDAAAAAASGRRGGGGGGGATSTSCPCCAGHGVETVRWMSPFISSACWTMMLTHFFACQQKKKLFFLHKRARMRASPPILSLSSGVVERPPHLLCSTPPPRATQYHTVVRTDCVTSFYYRNLGISCTLLITCVQLLKY